MIAQSLYRDRRDLKLQAEAWMKQRNWRGDYANQLIERAGRPMERALIRAKQRFEKQRPAHIRASALHRGYALKRR